MPAQIFSDFTLEVSDVLRDHGIGVIPTDTLYGLVGSAFSPEVVERIYRLRKRSLTKPLIVLIASRDDLGLFGIQPTVKEIKFLEAVWPGKVSVVFPCKAKKFAYLHRGLKSLAFRVPAKEELRLLLELNGPLVAPSANFGGEKPAETIAAARQYFGDQVELYLDDGRQQSAPSTLVKLTGGVVEILRPGAGLVPKVV